MKTTRREFIKQSSIATIIATGMGPLLFSEIGCAQTQDNKEKAFATDSSGFIDTTDPINRVPYIATYYITPKTNTGKDILINYYVTDYEHKEYMHDDYSERFVIDYWVNGKKQTVKDVKAGDNSITLKPLPKGKVLLALQATDKEGRKSHRLYQEFLVVDPKEEVIPENKIYHPDLKKFNIYNDDTHPVETTAGLTAMLKWAHENGYRKVLLPQGRYRLDENNTVQMATNLTLDMNGSTFKLNPSKLDRAMMLEMYQCVDSHVINGTFEGDLKEREHLTPKDGEWVSGVKLAQGSQYCSFRDVTVIDMMGHGTDTGMGGAGTRTYSAAGVKAAGNFVPGDIDTQGKLIASTARATTDKPLDISKFVETTGFLQFGLYLGYQGNPTGSWIYKASFYDADQKFLESIEGYMYRHLHPPKEAKFVRFTVYSSTSPENLADYTKRLRVFNIPMPSNCAFINVQHKNIRCVGMCPSGFNNLLAEGCIFDNCGWAKGKCAFDSEDGWDMMQDLTFRNNIFGKNPNNDFLTADGHNFVMEGNTMKVYMYDRTRGSVYRNNTIKSAGFLYGSRQRSGYSRIHNNVIKGNTRLMTRTSDNFARRPDCEFCIRDNDLQGDVTAAPQKGATVSVAYLYKCKSSGENFNAKAVKCDISNVKNHGGAYAIYDSNIENCFLRVSAPDSHSVIEGSTIKNSEMNALRGAITLKNNTMSECACVTTSSWVKEDAFVLIGNTIETSKEALVSVGNSYKQVILIDNVITSTNPKFTAVRLVNPIKEDLTTQVVGLTGNTFNAKGGLALDVLRMPNPSCTLTVYLLDNKYNGIEEINQKATTAPNIKIARQKVPEELLSARASL